MAPVEDISASSQLKKKRRWSPLCVTISLPRIDIHRFGFSGNCNECLLTEVSGCSGRNAHVSMLYRLYYSPQDQTPPDILQNSSQTPSVIDKQRQRWLSAIQELLRTVPWNRIINCDETAWLLHPNGILTWADMGAQSVQAKIDGNAKENFPVVASVSAAGEKLPLEFIATGKTIRVETT
jgi:hypothetical protein